MVVEQRTMVEELQTLAVPTNDIGKTAFIKSSVYYKKQPIQLSSELSNNSHLLLS